MHQGGVGADAAQHVERRHRAGLRRLPRPGTDQRDELAHDMVVAAQAQAVEDPAVPGRVPGRAPALEHRQHHRASDVGSHASRTGATPA